MAAGVVPLSRSLLAAGRLLLLFSVLLRTLALPPSPLLLLLLPLLVCMLLPPSPELHRL
jgi:hypothetical protein